MEGRGIVDFFYRSNPYERNDTMKLNNGHSTIVTWGAGSLLMIGIVLIVAGELIHAEGFSGIVLRTFVTLGIALVISSLVTLFVDY